MDEYTPTTAQVREAYAIDPEYEYHQPDDPGYVHRNRRAFDRWLASRDAEVKCAAWDECLSEIDANEINTQQAREGNPYREGAGVVAEQQGPWFFTAEDYQLVVAERDRARATAVRLEQELVHLTAERDRLILLASGRPGRSLAAGAGMVGGRVALHGVPVITDEVLRARAEGWRPAGGLVSE